MKPVSLVADGALLLWIPLAIVLFLVMRPDRAALVTIFGGLLFLPELDAFKLPLLPPFDKQTIPYIAALIGYTIRARRTVWHLPRERWVVLVTLIILADGVGIALTNGDSLTYGVWRKIEIPGLTIKDGMSVAMGGVFRIAIPFFVGSVVVRNASDLEGLFRFLMKAGLLYGFFALIEVRLSPQMHNWVYGYHQHEFGQTVRFGGYRPMLFMAHGLAVAMFFVVCLLSATVLARLRLRGPWGMGSKMTLLILGIVLVLCKSTGALVYAAVCVPLVFSGSAKLQQRIAALLAAIVLLYPSMREADVFPTDTVLSLAGLAGPDRRESVEFRFRNEDLLVHKARQRPWFGWGEYNRNAVFDDGGRGMTVTDGEWIIALGIEGFTGFLSRFGLLIIPVFLAGRRLRQLRDNYERRLIAATSLIVAVTALDLLPNSLFSNYPYFLSGVLLSVSGTLVRSQSDAGQPASMAGAGYVLRPPS